MRALAPTRPGYWRAVVRWLRMRSTRRPRRWLRWFLGKPSAPPWRDLARVREAARLVVLASDRYRWPDDERGREAAALNEALRKLVCR